MREFDRKVADDRRRLVTEYLLLMEKLDDDDLEDALDEILADTDARTREVREEFEADQRTRDFN